MLLESSENPSRTILEPGRSGRLFFRGRGERDPRGTDDGWTAVSTSFDWYLGWRSYPGSESRAAVDKVQSPSLRKATFAGTSEPVKCLSLIQDGRSRSKECFIDKGGRGSPSATEADGQRSRVRLCLTRES